MQVRKAERVGIGYRVGKLTVVGQTRERKNEYVVWRCRCDCGGEISLDTRYLQRGTVTDCGCGSKVRAGQKNLTGRRFGRLICLEPTPERGRSGGVIWRCRCDCGNECLAVSTMLTHGNKKSCGCLRRSREENLAGRRFGMLTVLESAGESRWRCRCDCGRETAVSTDGLRFGYVQSCGCQEQGAREEKPVCAASVRTFERRLRSVSDFESNGRGGVYYNPATGCWNAQITYQGKKYFLGSYRDIRDAIQMRERAERMYGEFPDWYRETFQ